MCNYRKIKLGVKFYHSDKAMLFMIFGRLKKAKGLQDPKHNIMIKHEKYADKNGLRLDSATLLRYKMKWITIIKDTESTEWK